LDSQRNKFSLLWILTGRTWKLCRNAPSKIRNLIIFVVFNEHLTMPHKQLLLYWICFLVYQNALSAQQVIIDSIHFIGHRKTRTSILFRELTFHAGDSLKQDELSKVLELNRLRLMNTGLFSWVKMNLKNWNEKNHANLEVSVQEMWYIWPIPIFEIADRNFSVWWDEQNHSLSRTNYGLRTTYRNLTGRKDPIQFVMQSGYTSKYSLGYLLPALNRTQTLGMSLSTNYAFNRETSVETSGNKLKFFRDDRQKVIQSWGFGIGFSYRPKLLTVQGFSASYTNIEVADTVVRYNPDYFLNGAKKQHFVSLNYSASYDNRDNRPYPHEGHYAYLAVSKNGVLRSDNVHNLFISAGFSHYLPLGNRWTLESIFRGRTNLMSAKQPYNFSRAIGYGSDVIRGYQYYVVDGKDFGILKNALHYKFIDTEFKLNQWIPMNSFKTLPMQIYTAAGFDVGKVNDIFQTWRNPFANQWLYGTGVAVNIVFYYNLVYQIEYNWNHKGERALFLNFKGVF
jgi:outer membrane protein assembly factor BamA